MVLFSTQLSIYQHIIRRVCEEHTYILVFRGHVCLGILTLNWVLWQVLCSDTMVFKLNAAQRSLDATAKQTTPPQ